MSICTGCNRVLAPNGSCLYCGTAAMRDVFGKPLKSRTGAIWRRRILLGLLAALTIHFFFFTPTGRGLSNPLLEKVGLKQPPPPSEKPVETP